MTTGTGAAGQLVRGKMCPVCNEGGGGVIWSVMGGPTAPDRGTPGGSGCHMSPHVPDVKDIIHLVAL